MDTRSPQEQGMSIKIIFSRKMEVNQIGTPIDWK